MPDRRTTSEKSKQGEIKLACVDEAGFAHAQPNRNAWTEKGKAHLITAERGKRLNVLAALISTGALFSARFWEAATAAAPVSSACFLTASAVR